MEWNFKEMYKLFSKGNNNKLLLDGLWGLENEKLRVKLNGDLALTPHPKVFGDKLKNPYVTTDFSESQLELITPPFKTIKEAYDFLLALKKYVSKQIREDEFLWPLSMPARLPEENSIPIAEFNNSREGLESMIYRRGLASRYGKKMQMISGIHYNFSFQQKMWDFLFNNFNDSISIKNFINESYLKIVKNFLRYKWLLLYLFGASSMYDNSYKDLIDKKIDIIKEDCKCKKELLKYSAYITSLRMSLFGYYNSLSENLKISFNNMDEYIDDFKKALSTKSSDFSTLGIYKDGKQIQLNDFLLQKENEYYFPIRIKPDKNGRGHIIDLLDKSGIGYLEIRIFDLNPFEYNGLNIHQLYFTHVFLIYCLFEKSEAISDEEKNLINFNHHLTALGGRKNDLKLYKYNFEKIHLKTWARQLLDKMLKIAQLIDKNNGIKQYEMSVLRQFQKLENTASLPSARIIQEMETNNESFIDFGLRKAWEYSNKSKKKEVKNELCYTRI